MITDNYSYIIESIFILLIKEQCGYKTSEISEIANWRNEKNRENKKNKNGKNI